MPKLSYVVGSTWVAQQFLILFPFLWKESSTPEAEANRKITVGTDMIMNARRMTSPGIKISSFPVPCNLKHPI